MQIRGRIADFDIRFSEWLGKAPNTGFYIACQTGCCVFLLRRTSLPFVDSEVIGGAFFFRRNWFDPFQGVVEHGLACDGNDWVKVYMRGRKRSDACDRLSMMLCRSRYARQRGGGAVGKV